MKINRDNYEQYFLDHAEGNLSPEMERELAYFLEANPDLKPILDDFDNSSLKATEVSNEKLKLKLRKKIKPTDHIREDNVDEWMARDMEGLLNETEKEELNKFLWLNPAYAYDLKLFNLTKMVADQSITFPRKNELKKKGALIPVSRLLWTLSAAAAVIILFFSIRFFQKAEVGTVERIITTEVIPEAEVPGSITTKLVTDTPAPEIKESAVALVTPSVKPENDIIRAYSFRLEPLESHSSITYGKSEALGAELLAYDNMPVQTYKEKEKPLIAKVFNNMVAKTRDNIASTANLDQISQPEFSLWAIARAGIEGYNSLADRDIELYVSKDAEGKVKSYALVDNERLIWSKDLARD
jgi:hypothetical protein